jgi:hypothetical protein
MRHETTHSEFLAIDLEVLAIHVMRYLTSPDAEAGRIDAAAIGARIGARRADVRRVLSALHGQGYVFLLHMRPTMLGFAVGRSLQGSTLRPIRAAARLASAA